MYMVIVMERRIKNNKGKKRLASSMCGKPLSEQNLTE